MFDFKRNDKTHELYFFGDRCIRVHEAGDNKPDVIEAPLPINKAEAKGNELIYRDCKVLVDEKGLLKIYLKDKLVLEEIYFEGGVAFRSNKPVYGLGDKAGPINRKGYSYINWNTDDPHPHTDTSKSLYKSIPFFVMFDKKRSAGVFINNTSKCAFDFNQSKDDEIRVTISEGGVDLYIFLGSFDEVTKAYSKTAGVGIMPRWALGAQQSRWSYADKESVLKVVEGYRKADIPLSAIYLDIDYMDRYMDFTISEERFPDMANFLSELYEQGIRVVPIIDAGVKVLDGYEFYEELMKIGGASTQNGEVYHNDVWPGECIFPAFIKDEVQLSWSKEVMKMRALGFSGMWCDMNEPASFKGEIPLDVDMGGYPHSVVHNVYGHLMAKATARGYKENERRFIMTRAAYAGSEKYATCWTGDNQSCFDHVGICLRQLPSMAISGYSLVGVDLGGFNGDSTGELLIRFAQANLLTPIFRNHSACGSISQEPYAFDKDTERRYRDLVMTRLELVPYMFSAMKEHYLDGSPMLRPLIYNFPKDENLLNENTEMMFGDALLLIPALEAGVKKREAYFPDDFYNFKTGKKYKKGYHLIDCGLDDCILFVRKGCIVPLAPKGYKTTEIPDRIRLLWTGGECKTKLYEEIIDKDGWLLGERHYEIEISEKGELVLAEEIIDSLPFVEKEGDYKKSFVVERLK
ncbi:MAG: glycoside hydrolase family 31 protein [Bacilli bacterium]|nr:glycoside hydrolase family 31 protein [Bacilli bacterium]